MSQVLLVSTFEGGFQPLSLASAGAFLRDHDFSVASADTYVSALDEEAIRKASVVAFSVPLFDALRAALPLAERVKEVNPRAHVTFYGQYATINAERVVGQSRDSAIVGEWEVPLARLASSVLEGRNGEPGEEIPGVYRRDSTTAKKPFMPRKGSPELLAQIRRGRASRIPDHGTHFRVPDRSGLPPLSRYPQPQVEKLLGEKRIVGGTEITRGCHHKCTYCSVFAAYDGRVFVIPEEVVLADVRQLVGMGMTHLTFVDAEFFNSKHHGINLLRKLHAEFPSLTYDLTTRVDHILEYGEVIREMEKLGVRFITSALEFPSDRVLQAVYKEVPLSMVEEVVAFMRTTGIRLNPTFVMFNPWVSLEEIASFHDWIDRNQLTDIVDPIQYETRLHLYKGSPLLKDSFIQSLRLTEEEFHYQWEHPDPRVDELFHNSVSPPQAGEFKRCCLKC